MCVYLEWYGSCGVVREHQTGVMKCRYHQPPTLLCWEDRDSPAEAAADLLRYVFKENRGEVELSHSLGRTSASLLVSPGSVSAAVPSLQSQIWASLWILSVQEMKYYLVTHRLAASKNLIVWIFQTPQPKHQKMNDYKSTEDRRQTDTQ